VKRVGEKDGQLRLLASQLPCGGRPAIGPRSLRIEKLHLIKPRRAFQNPGDVWLHHADQVRAGEMFAERPVSPAWPSRRRRSSWGRRLRVSSCRWLRQPPAFPARAWSSSLPGTSRDTPGRRRLARTRRPTTLVLAIVGALHQHIGPDDFDEVQRRVLVEHRQEIDGTDGGQHLCPCILAVNGTLWSLESPDACITIETDHEEVGLRAALL